MSNGQRMSRREMIKRRKRRKKIIITISLLLLMAIFFVVGRGAIYLIRGGAIKPPIQEFDIFSEFTGEIQKKEQLRTETFASDLCIVKDDVALEGVSIENPQTAVLFNINDREVLYSKGAYQRVYPASITKIMTAMVALKYGDMDEIVTITQEDVTLEEGSQVCGFQAGDQATMEQLIYCLLVYSGNDAASAISRHIGGNQEAFVGMMNAYAAQLGCTGTHFSNPHGLHDEEHYTTPYDIYLMLNEAWTYPKFTEMTQLSSYTLVYTKYDGTEMTTYLPATDHYLTGEAATPKNVTILGGKTGTTSAAGNCLALLSQNEYGKPYVSIVMGAQTKDVLYEQMSSLLQNINNF